MQLQIFSQVETAAHLEAVVPEVSALATLHSMHAAAAAAVQRGTVGTAEFLFNPGVDWVAQVIAGLLRMAPSIDQ
jgi:hypothetical protein